jgi:hypothetical protein
MQVGLENRTDNTKFFSLLKIFNPTKIELITASIIDFGIDADALKDSSHRHR